jgi:hypothetical protein
LGWRQQAQARSNAGQSTPKNPRFRYRAFSIGRRAHKNFAYKVPGRSVMASHAKNSKHKFSVLASSHQGQLQLGAGPVSVWRQRAA